MMMKMENLGLEYRLLTKEYDAPLAALIRKILRENGLDVPGTAYFDEALDHLSGYYERSDGFYYVLLENDDLIGGVGIERFGGFEDCCELQKLYLSEKSRGCGIGYEMMRFIEGRARESGYRHIYLETHTNLNAAIHLYEKCGYRLIRKPPQVVHGAMNRFYLKDL